MLRRAVVAGVLAVLVSRAARAELPPPPPEPEPVPVSRWYGGTTLAIDLGAAAVGGLGVLLFFGVSERGDHPIWPLAITVVPAYAALLVGGPIVHWTHGHVGKGFGSLAMRLFLPVIGSVLDIALLSRETVVERPPVALVPTLTADAHGFTAGAALTF
jgi:hypothetical protein